MLRLIAKATIPVIGSDSRMAKLKSCHRARKVPKSLKAAEKK